MIAGLIGTGLSDMPGGRERFARLLLNPVFLLMFFTLHPVLCPAQEVEWWSYNRFHFEHEDRGYNNYLRLYEDLKVSNIVPDTLDARVTGWFNFNPTDGGDWIVNHNYARFSNAYLNFRYPDPRLSVTAGRQLIDGADCFIIDGLYANLFNGGKKEFFLFGGMPVSFYSGTDGEYIVGGGFIYRPAWRTWMQADAFVIEEDGVLYDAVALQASHSMPFNTRAYGRLRLLRREVRDIYATLSSYFEVPAVSAYLSYYVQPETRGEGEEATSKYFSRYGQIFNASYPFQMVNLQLRKYVGEKWILVGGAVFKRLLRDPGVYPWSNVDSDIFNAGLTRLDLFTDGLDVTILGNYVENRNDTFYDVTGELSYGFTKTLSSSIGLTYTGYRFADIEYPDTLNGQPSVYNLADHIGSRIYYADLGYTFKKNHKISIAASYEDVDTRYSDAVVVQLGYRFKYDLSFGDKSAGASRERDGNSKDETAQ